jgi:hypothetical protein
MSHIFFYSLYQYALFQNLYTWDVKSQMFFFFRLIRVNLYDLRPSHLIRSTLEPDLTTRFYNVALTLSYPSL